MCQTVSYAAVFPSSLQMLCRSLMRGLGGFFVRRKMDRVAGTRDHIYRAVLHTVSVTVVSLYIFNYLVNVVTLSCSVVM